MALAAEGSRGCAGDDLDAAAVALVKSRDVQDAQMRLPTTSKQEGWSA